ncbi:hypothetical protein MKW98_019574 [Papaver atlanticum]|uniref:Uncharacterized protein n=1 Tax=Papaver atlanticum TaxID=357466 RepID=A0AAD4XA61_9MAGN|nr:hypothetical protein MKW98_019574 [Papaver atlanticum]
MGRLVDNRGWLLKGSFASKSFEGILQSFTVCRIVVERFVLDLVVGILTEQTISVKHQHTLSTSNNTTNMCISSIQPTPLSKVRRE